MKKLADAIHQAEPKAIAQMSSHMGSMDEVDPASPSGVRLPFVGWSFHYSFTPRIITRLT